MQRMRVASTPTLDLASPSCYLESGCGGVDGHAWPDEVGRWSHCPDRSLPAGIKPGPQPTSPPSA